MNALFVLLGNLAAVSHSSRMHIQSNRLVEEICNVMQNFIPGNEHIVENGCAVIANICIDSECRSRLGSCGAWYNPIVAIIVEIVILFAL